MAAATNTSLYKLNHTMLRVKDPKATVKFYEENFGMPVIHRMDFEEAKFSLYFLAFDSPKAENHGMHWTNRESVLELTHNYGTENDPDYKVANGNTEPARDMTLYLKVRFGHMCFTVDNIEYVCQKLEKNGVNFQKKLTDGRQRNTAYALDPDGYWVELVGQAGSDPAATTTDLGTYRFNHSMIRIKDPEKSLNFYRSVLGMSLLWTMEQPEAKFNVYFLGYRHGQDDEKDMAKLLSREGVVGLTWDYGTENVPNFKYHNGNNQPQGFGHLCITVDDLDAACARFEDLNVNWKKRLTDGRMKTVAFILDPDEYWIEVLQNEAFKSHANW